MDEIRERREERRKYELFQAAVHLYALNNECRIVKWAVYEAEEILKEVEKREKKEEIL